MEELLRYVARCSSRPTAVAAEPVTSAGCTWPGESVLCHLRRPTGTRRGSPTRTGWTSPGTPNRHLAFGHGIHYCLGAPLARLEARIAFRALLAGSGSISLAVPAASLRWRPSTLIHGLESLPVRLAP